MDFLLIAYILVSIVTIVGLFFVNFSSGKPILAALSSIGVLGASILFGIRWFPGGRFSVGEQPVSQGSKWPPSINVCPDYLTFIKLSGKPYCIDPIGVSRRNGTNQGMNKYTEGSTDPQSLFNLYADKSGEARTSALVDECKAKGVVWEGIYNGAVPLGGEAPMPP